MSHITEGMKWGEVTNARLYECLRTPADIPEPTCPECGHKVREHSDFVGFGCRVRMGGDTLCPCRKSPADLQPKECDHQNLVEATKRACQEPSLLEALSFICIWESERIVKQARENPTWETCFKISLKSVLDNYPADLQPKECDHALPAFDICAFEGCLAEGMHVIHGRWWCENHFMKADPIRPDAENTTLLDLHKRLLNLMGLPEDVTIFALYKHLIESHEAKVDSRVEKHCTYEYPCCNKPGGVEECLKGFLPPHKPCPYWQPVEPAEKRYNIAPAISFTLEKAKEAARNAVIEEGIDYKIFETGAAIGTMEYRETVTPEWQEQ